MNNWSAALAVLVLNLTAAGPCAAAGKQVNLRLSAQSVLAPAGRAIPLPTAPGQQALQFPAAVVPGALEAAPSAEQAAAPAVPFSAQPLLDASAQAQRPRDAAGEAEQVEQFKAAFDGARPGKPAKGVSVEWVQGMIEKEAAVDAGGRRMRDVVQRLGFSQAALNGEVLADHNAQYTVEIAQGPITNQKASGRCWIFAGLNMIRSMMLADAKVAANSKAAAGLELSENYLHFFNMLEKSNGHLDEVVAKVYKRHPKSEKFDEEKRRAAVVPSLGDGGWYDYFSFLVAKYGLVPKSAMPETISSEATASLIRELNASLAATSAELMANAKLYKARKAPNRSRRIQERGMARIWKILATHLGAPPAAVEYREDSKAETANGMTRTKAAVSQMTPKEFAANVAKFDPLDYVVVSNYPAKKADAVYEIKKSAIGAARPGEPKFDLRFMNLNAERMEQLAAAAIEGGQPVWFAADVQKDVDTKSGIMHPALYDRAPIYEFTKDEAARQLSRKEQAYFQQLVPNHAMLLTGFDRPDPDKPIVKFKNENSWGDTNGSKGVYHLYRAWFLENVFEIVVHKRFLSDAERALWESKPRQTKNKA